ncbi:MAG: hypothetical protein J6T42_00950, partial [Clostridia bacterium]|nr:hypothetical protein [Clostridia bacterium]
TDYSNIFLNREMELKMWNHLDFIISISDEVGKRFLHIFPSLKEKVFLIENILSCEFIRKRANEFEPMDMEKKEDVINLLSIGRFSYPKRFDEIGTICRLMLEELKIRKFNKNVICC